MAYYGPANLLLTEQQLKRSKPNPKSYCLHHCRTFVHGLMVPFASPVHTPAHCSHSAGSPWARIRLVLQRVRQYREPVVLLALFRLDLIHRADSKYLGVRGVGGVGGVNYWIWEVWPILYENGQEVWTVTWDREGHGGAWDRWGNER